MEVVLEGGKTRGREGVTNGGRSFKTQGECK